MGRDVIDRYPSIVTRCSEVLGWDVRAQCLDGAHPGLDDTRYVQPALFLVECLTAQAARDDGADLPMILAGHSLGEYAALCCAGSFELVDGVRLVAVRGEAMSQTGGGTMAAVLGLDAAAVRRLISETVGTRLDLANINSSAQVVVAGPAQAVEEFGAVVRHQGARYQRLAVSAPFHSRYMSSARQRLAQALQECSMRPPALPVISNVTGRPHAADGIRELLLQQLTSPVDWLACMRELYRRGVREVCEQGPGRTLVRLWEQEEQALATVPATNLPGSEPAPDPAAGLGSAAFREDYGVELACLAGSMYKGISSVDLVTRMARGGMLAFLGTGGLSAQEVRENIGELTRRLGRGGRFGVNLIHQPGRAREERAVVDTAMAHGVRFAEVSSYTHVTPDLVRFRFAGVDGHDGAAPSPRHVVVKASRPEVAGHFLRPAPAPLVDELEARGELTAAEARLARSVPVAGDLCVESDSGGHTDGGNPVVLLPTVMRLRDRLGATTRIGASGGVGSPESVAALFRMGADFVVTGSVNQCTAEAGTSEAVKELLCEIDVTDTTYAPAGDMLELGARVQVVRRRTMFAARANRLVQLARWHDCLEALPAAVRDELESRILRRPLEDVWHQVEQRYGTEAGSAGPRERMLLTFRWYFAWTTELALRGDPNDLVHYQVHCGPAMGLANDVFAGTGLERWQDRHVDDVNRRLMTGAADLLSAGASRRPRP